MPLTPSQSCPIAAAVGLVRGRALVLSVACFVAGLTAGPAMSAEPKPVEFTRDIKPVLQRLCVGCHGPRKQAAKLRLDTLSPDIVKGTGAETWHDVLNKLNLGEMPPEKAPAQPTASERRLLVRWLTAELRRAEEVARSTGGRVVMRRLTRYEYNNTLRDLLGVEFDFSGNLPPESVSRDGFQNNGSVLGISPIQVEYYLKAARLALGKAIVTGPRPEVIKHHAIKSAKVRRVKGEVSNRLGPSSRFLVRLEKFPREGEVVVRVRAHAVVPDKAGFPRMKVTLGVRADVRAPEETLAEIDVTNTEPKTFTFRGRIESFPLPGHNPKYPGLQVTVYNAYEDGKPIPKKKRMAKKNRKNLPVEPDPTQPLLVVESVDFEGPVFDTWPPRTHSQIFFQTSGKPDERTYASKILSRFMTRAYRRPVEESEVTTMLALFDTLRARSPSLEKAVGDLLAVVLISPEFLYLVEPRDDSAGRQPLGEFELASRMSYFLWSTMPDDRLFKLARDGKLSDPSIRQAEVRRMLADPRAWQFVEHFTDQWLDLPALDRVAVNPEFHPRFDDRLKRDMRSETQHFFAEILSKDLSAMNLVDSDFTMVNRRLAGHYGLPLPPGGDMQRVDLPEGSRRGGLLTQGSFLLSNSNGEDSHPIRRAVWLLDRLLDDPPPPPPPDVPDLETNKPNVAKLSLKQQLELHREKAACNNCHKRIDPWGVVFENFDAVGQWRTVVSGSKRRRRPTRPVDAVVELPDGTGVDGVDGRGGIKNYLVTVQGEAFARALVKRLLTYSLGRSLEYSDRGAVDDLTRRFIKSEYRLKELIVAISGSQPFVSK